jgi:antitoxin PrlF
MSSSKVTSKFQATIPKDIRKLLKIKAGDRIIFECTNNEIRVRKQKPLDVAYLQSLEHSWSEWNTPEDEEAYADLQQI